MCAGNRDLGSQVQNGTVFTYSYANDAISRRAFISRSGSAHSTSHVLSHAYHDRNKLTGTASSMDTTYCSVAVFWWNCPSSRGGCGGLGRTSRFFAWFQR